MARKIFLGFLVLLILCLWCLAAFATDNKPKPKKEVSKPTPSTQESIRVEDMKVFDGSEDPLYQSAGVFGNPFIQASPTASPHYDTMGTTYYDLGANYRLQRHIALSPLGHIHTTFTKTTAATQAVRAVYYRAWFNAASPPTSPAEIQVSDNDGRGGFTGCTVLPDGRAAAVYHRALAIGPVKSGTFMSVETVPTAGDFGGTEFHASDSIVPMRVSAIWPDGAGQKYKDTMRVHIVWTEGNIGLDAPPGGRYLGYTRAKEASTGFFSFTPAKIFDSTATYISAAVVASQKSSKVAIVFAHRRHIGVAGSDGSDADLIYIESQTGGDDWINGFKSGGGAADTFVNITNHADSDPLRASGDLTAAYDESDSLIITFWAAYNHPVDGALRTSGALYFWSKTQGLRKVYDVSTPVDPLGRLSHIFPINNPQIGVYKDTAAANAANKGDYYIIWTAGVDPDTSDDGTWNGDIYCTASTNNGFTWSKAANITNSDSSGCAIGTCDHDAYASLARDINDTMHIAYMNDKYSNATEATASGDAALATLNRWFYLKQPTYIVGKDTLAAVSPSVFSDFCILQGGTKDTTVYIENVGNQDLTVNSIVKNQAFASYTVAPPYNATPFTILEGGVRAEVTLSMNATALPCSAYAVTWTVNTNAENSNKGNPKGVFTIDAEFVVYTALSPFYTRKTQVVQCGGVLLSISNTGNVGNANDTAGMYIIADTTNFLYEGSEIFGTILTSGDTVGAHDFHAGRQYHPLYNPTTLGDIEVKDTVFTDSVSFATALSLGRPAKAGTWRVARVYYAVYLPGLDTCPWPGPWFGYWICEQWWWKVSPAPKFKWVIWYKKKIKQGPPCWWPKWPAQPKIAMPIYDGLVCDWDVASDSAVLNDGAYNDTFKMAYATGRGTPYDKYYGATVFLVDTSLHLKDSTVYNANGLFAAHVLSNDDLFGYSSYDSWLYYWACKPGVKHQFAPYEDIHTVTTSVCFDTTVSQVTYAQGLAVTIKGLDTLKTTVNEMRRCMALDTLQLAPPCPYFAGDANKSNTLTLPDIILLVGHVFKGQPAPDPKCLGDCNNTNTITLPDIIILVGHVFKGQPKPPKDLDGPCCK